MIEVTEFNVDMYSNNAVVRLKMKINNIVSILKIRVRARNPTFEIIPNSYIDMNILEKVLSKVRGFITDKRNYKQFDKQLEIKLNRIIGNSGLGEVEKRRKVTLLDIFDNILRIKMKMNTNISKSDYKEKLEILGIGSTDIEIILNDEKLSNVFSE